jgi:hypothetical protein
MATRAAQDRGRGSPTAEGPSWQVGAGGGGFPSLHRGGLPLEEAPAGEAQVSQVKAGASPIAVKVNTPPPQVKAGPSPITGARPLLLEATARGVTRQGEMFSARDLGQLGGDIPGLATSVVRAWDVAYVLGALAQGDLLLIPFDRSSSNERPCLKQGVNAHWGMLRGFAVPMSDGDREGVAVRAFAAEDEVVFSTPSAEGCLQVDAGKAIGVNPDEVAVVYLQGMAGRQVVAPLKHLIESNTQLLCVHADCPELNCWKLDNGEVALAKNLVNCSTRF